MGIVDDDIVRVRESSDIVAIISEHVQLKRVGRRFSGLCPFHSEKSGSFSVNPEEHVYYCFGCGAKGDVITFVREIEHLDFVGAVEFLAGKAGIILRYTDKDEGEGRKKRTRLLDAMGRAVEWYHERLLSAPDAAQARGYLRSRGLSGDEVRAYKIGWAPEGWDELVKALKLPDDVAIDAGPRPAQQHRPGQRLLPGPGAVPDLRRQGRPGRLRRAHPARGRGLEVLELHRQRRSTPRARCSTGSTGPRAPSSTPTRSSCARATPTSSASPRPGCPLAVATCGTSLTEEHFKALKSFAQRIVLAFDADAAGQNAAARFYEWERSYDLDVAVAALPAGRRPRRPQPLRPGGAGRRGRATPRRSSASGSTGCSTRRRWSRPRVGPAPPRRPWPSSASTRATWSATSTSWRSRRAVASTPTSCGPAPSPGPGRGRSGGRADPGPGRARSTSGPAATAPQGPTRLARGRGPAPAASPIAELIAGFLVARPVRRRGQPGRLRAPSPRRPRCATPSSRPIPPVGRPAAAPGRRGDRGRGRRRRGPPGRGGGPSRARDHPVRGRCGR